MVFKIQPLKRLSSIDAAGLVCLLGYMVLAWYSHGTLEDPNLGVFFGMIFWVSIPVAVAFFLNTKLTFWKVLIWALTFRLCGLGSEPLFEDDFYRYLWDGFVFVEKGTPYGFLPVDFFGDTNVPQVIANLLDGINYPDLPTIYGPTNQYIFALSYVIDPGRLWPVQTVLVVLDMLLIWLLSRFAETRYVLLYAWCPLVIKEIAFTAHPEVIGICFIFTAFMGVHLRKFVLAGIFLALAVGAKVFALAIAPFILIRVGWKGWLAFVGVLLGLYLPFLLQGSSEFTSLLIFAKNWVFNASLYSLLATATTPFTSKVILGTFYLIVLAVLFQSYRRHGMRSIPRGDLIFGVFLLCAPVVNPWYLLWVLPFSVVYPSVAAWVASLAVFLAYVTSINLGDYESDPFAQPIWVLIVEYGVVCVALLIDFLMRHKSNTYQSEMADNRFE